MVSPLCQDSEKGEKIFSKSHIGTLQKKESIYQPQCREIARYNQTDFLKKRNPIALTIIQNRAIQSPHRL